MKNHDGETLVTALWRKELPLARLAEKEVERSRKKHDFETSSRR